MQINKQKLAEAYRNFKTLILKLERDSRNYFSAKGADIYTRFVRRMFFIFILACIIAGITSITVLFIARIAKPLTKVPSVKGMNVVEAAMQIKENGLIAEINSKFDSEYPKYTVIEQYPKKGVTVRQGRTVSLIVSMGKDVYTAPNLVGLSRQEAENLLLKLNIGYEITVIQSADFGVNTVVSQNIEPEKETDRMVKMKLLVNSDVSRGEFKVDDYTRQNVDTVVKLLFASSIQPTLQNVSAKNQEEDGLVLAQSIANGTIVQKNTDITLQIGIYGEDDLEKEKNKYYIFTYHLDAPTSDTNEQTNSAITATETQASADVRIIVTDEKNRQQEIYNKISRYGDTIILTFKSYGNSVLSLFIDNSFVKEIAYE